MAGTTPIIIDLDAEGAKLTMLRGRTAQTNFAERRRSGSAVNLGRYRDGMLLLAKSAGNSHWETHPADELLYVVEGEMIVDIVHKDGPRSCTLGAGMIGIVPPGAWHRVHAADGVSVMSATLPGDHIEVDHDDPRAAGATPANATEGRMLSVVDLNAELAKLTMFRDRTPQSTMADRKGSGARVADYRDGGLFVTKFAGKGHWEAHLSGDELIYLVDGACDHLEELVCSTTDAPKSFALRAGMMAVNLAGVHGTAFPLPRA